MSRSARRTSWAGLAPQGADQYATLLAASGRRCTCSGDRCGQPHQHQPRQDCPAEGCTLPDHWRSRTHQGDRCQESGTAREPLLAVAGPAGALVVLCQGCARRAEALQTARSAAEALPLF